MEKITIVDIHKVLSYKCDVCKTTLVKIMPRTHSDYWFCSKCDLNYEISHLGQVLRRFRPTPSVVIQTGEKP